MTTGGSLLKTKNAVEHHASKRGYSLVVPRVYAVIRRMESTPEKLLAPHGVDLSYIFTTREVLGWSLFLYERGLIELDPRCNELWKPNL